MKTRIYLSVCIAVLSSFIACTTTQSARCNKKYVSGIMYPGHSFSLKCKDPFKPENGISPDTLVARIGKATSCEINKDTLRLFYVFKFTPTDSLTRVCQEGASGGGGVGGGRARESRYKFINGKLVDRNVSIYK